MIPSVREFVANLAGALYHREIHWEPKGLIEDRLRDERAKPMPTHEVLAVFDQVLAVHDARVKAEALEEYAESRYAAYLEDRDTPWPDQPSRLAQWYAKSLEEMRDRAAAIRGEQ